MEQSSLDILYNIIPLVTSIGTAGFFIVKWILSNYSDTTTFDRSQIITTKQWLAREERWDKDLKEQRAFYESKLTEQKSYYEKVIALKDSQIEKQNIQIEELKDKVRTLGHDVKNLQQVNTTADELKKIP